MNVTNQDQVLSEDTTIGHGKSAVWAANIEDQEPEPRQNKQLSKQLREVIAGARPNQSIREAQALDELIVDNQDIFETKGGEHGRIENCTTGQVHSPASLQTPFSEASRGEYPIGGHEDLRSD